MCTVLALGPRIGPIKSYPTKRFSGDEEAIMISGYVKVVETPTRTAISNTVATEAGRGEILCM